MCMCHNKRAPMSRKMGPMGPISWPAQRIKEETTPVQWSCSGGCRDKLAACHVDYTGVFTLIVNHHINDYVTTLHNCRPPVEDLWPCANDMDNADV